MSHLDEGTLHALLDGELDTTETRQIEAHLDRCTTCGTRLEEIKQVRTEADRLIESLAVAPAQPDEPPDEPAAASARPAAPVSPVPIAPPPRPASDTWSGPILLIPELPEDVALAEQRRKRQRRWAAIIVLAIGLTYGGIQLSRRAGSTPVALSGADEPSAAPAASAPVLSPQEAIVPPARTDTGLQAGIAMPKSDSFASAHNVHPSGSAATGDASRAAPPVTPAPMPAPVQRNRRELAQAQQARPALPKTPAASEQSRDITPPPPSAPEPAAAPAPAPVVTAPPPPPSLEERAAIYLRIGLDEAQRQLGGPMHVIEEMSPALVGLVQGKDSPGMDDTRPVVRAVYLDATNHLILLDQQRMRAGQSPGPASPLRMVIGDVLIHLRGGSNPNVLRNLIPRIR